jgi:hypothetical protein
MQLQLRTVTAFQFSFTGWNGLILYKKKAHLTQLGMAVWRHHRPRRCFELRQRDRGGRHKHSPVKPEHRVRFLSWHFMHPN